MTTAELFWAIIAASYTEEELRDLTNLAWDAPRLVPIELREHPGWSVKA